MITDAHGRPRVLCLTGGHTHDIRPVAAMLEKVEPTVRIIADKAYDCAALRDQLQARNIKAVIPNRATRKQPYAFDAVTYKRRNVVERTFCRLKDFRRLAMRYDRLIDTYMATVCIASIVAYWLK
jgi:transposase